MIYTTMGEAVQVIAGPFLDLLDPSTMLPLYEYVDVQSVEDLTWVRRRRVCELKADGGFPEIEVAIQRLRNQKEKP